MSLVSIKFLFMFLPVILIIYYVIPGKFKNLALLLGSLVFYALGDPRMLLLLACSIIFHYLMGMWIEETQKKTNGGGRLLAIACVMDLGTFVFFGLVAPRAELTSMVPLGLGIYTLQAVSYVADIWKRKVKAQRSFLDFALYMSMFPLFFAGPVVRYRELQKQLSVRKLSWMTFGVGALTFTCGLLKKILFADRLEAAYQQILSMNSGEVSVLTAWIGVVAFALQLYFAFSGYCDMASGLAKMFGFDVKANFKYPYLAGNMTDFVTRWNRSLWAWFKEYVCDPLFGGWLGTLVSWILIGLWYSAWWNYAPWETTLLNGLWWGIYVAFWLIAERYFLPFLKRLPILLKNIYTMLLVLIGWGIFMCPTPAKAVTYLVTMFGIGGHGLVDDQGMYLLISNGILFIVMILGSMPLLKLIWQFLLSRLKKDPEQRKKREFLFYRNAAMVFASVLALTSLANVVVKDQGAAEGEEPFVFRPLVKRIDTGIDLLVGRRESFGVFKGTDQYLLGEIAKPDQELVTRNLDNIEALTRAYPDIETYMALIPDAANVWKDKLPAGAVVENQSEQLAQIKSMLDGSIKWLDAESILASHAKEEIYYHTDSHWTTLGAKYVWEQLAQAMGLDPNVAPAMKEYAITGDFNGDLSRKSGYESGYADPIYAYLPVNESEAVGTVVDYVSEGIRTAALYDTNAFEEADQYEVFLGGDFDRINIRTTANSNRRLLLVKDSWANCLIPFLTPYFREIIVIDPELYEGNVQEILDGNRITDILILYHCNDFVQNDSFNEVFANDQAE